MPPLPALTAGLVPPLAAWFLFVDDKEEKRNEKSEDKLVFIAGEAPACRLLGR